MSPLLRGHPRDDRTSRRHRREVHRRRGDGRVRHPVVSTRTTRAGGPAAAQIAELADCPLKSSAIGAIDWREDRDHTGEVVAGDATAGRPSPGRRGQRRCKAPADGAAGRDPDRREIRTGSSSRLAVRGRGQSSCSSRKGEVPPLVDAFRLLECGRRRRRQISCRLDAPLVGRERRARTPPGA